MRASVFAPSPCCRQLRAVARDHLLELGLPPGDAVGEALRQHVEHDRHGRRRSRRGAEQARRCVPSADATTSVPNWMTGLAVGIPLHDLHALAGRDRGASRRAARAGANCCSARCCLPRVGQQLGRPGTRPARGWSGRPRSACRGCASGSSANRSRQDPVFRNLGVNPAYGPNSRLALPSTTRVSRCGTDIGGEPTAALP